MKPEEIRDRRLALGLTQGELAERAGTSQQNIDRLERGLVKHSRYLAAVLKALAPDPSRTAAYVAPPAPPPSDITPPPGWLKVYAIAVNAAGEHVIGEQPSQLMPGPPGLHHPAFYGVVVADALMAPAFEAGDIAWIDPRLGPRAEANVLLRAREPRSGETRVLLRRFVGASEKAWTVRQLQPAKRATLQRAVWTECHRIIGRSDRTG